MGTWSEPVEGRGSIPPLTEGEQEGGGKGQIKNRQAARATKGEASLNTRLIEEAKA